MFMENKKSQKGGSVDQEESDRVGISDALKRIVTAGIGAAFMTEEHIRSYVSDLKLPKDVLNLLLQSANKSKEDVINKISNEVIKVINKIDFVAEASRFVEEHKFKISAEVEVVKKHSVAGEEKSLSAKVKLKN